MPTHYTIKFFEFRAMRVDCVSVFYFQFTHLLDRPHYVRDVYPYLCTVKIGVRAAPHYLVLQDVVLRERLGRIVLLVPHYSVLQDAVLQDRTASATLSSKNATTAPQARLSEREVAIIIIIIIIIITIIIIIIIVTTKVKVSPL